MNRLDGKYAVITGGTQGLGAAIARTFAEAGAGLPYGRLVTPEEVAIAVTFLASADSGLMTGSVVNFDQSVWGGSNFAPPTPDRPISL